MYDASLPVIFFISNWTRDHGSSCLCQSTATNYAERLVPVIQASKVAMGEVRNTEGGFFILKHKSSVYLNLTLPSHRSAWPAALCHHCTLCILRKHSESSAGFPPVALMTNSSLLKCTEQQDCRFLLSCLKSNGRQYVRETEVAALYSLTWEVSLTELCGA